VVLIQLPDASQGITFAVKTIMATKQQAIGGRAAFKARKEKAISDTDQPTGSETGNRRSTHRSIQTNTAR